MSTSTSNTKKKLGILIVILVLAITATETFIGIFEDKLEERPIYTAKQTLMNKEWDYLIIGTSVSLGGIDPSQIDPALANASYPSLQPMGAYLVLKRYLQKHKPPKRVFFSLSPIGYSWDRDNFFLDDFLKNFLYPSELPSIWADLSPFERAQLILWRLPSYKNQYKIQHYVRSWMRAKLNKAHFFIDNKQDNALIENAWSTIFQSQWNGLILSPYSNRSMNDTEGDLADDFRFAASVRNIKYFEKFLDLAQKNNIPVVIYQEILCEKAYAQAKTRGDYAQYVAFRKQLENRHPFIRFIYDYPPYLSNKYFAEITHFNRWGMQKFTEIFKTKVWDVAKSSTGASAVSS